MSIRRAITLASTLTFITLALTAVPAGAHATRELVTSFGSIEAPSGLAVDLETGNVYVSSDKTPTTVYVFGPTGGAPLDGVPSRITELDTSESEERPAGIAVDNSCYEHEPRLTGSACEEYDPSYGDVYVVNEAIRPRGIQKFKLNAKHQYELVGEIPSNGGPHGVTIDAHGNVYAVKAEELVNEYIVEFKKIVEKVTNGGVEETKERLEEIRIPYATEIENLSYVTVDDAGDLYVSSYDEYEPKSADDHWPGVVKLKLGAAGNVLSEEIFTGNRSIGTKESFRRPLAVDPFTGAVYVGDGPEIAEYNSTGALQLEFGSTEPFGGAFGTEFNGAIAIAVNGLTERVYVANPLQHDVDVFGPVLGPPVIEAQQPPASSIAQTSALLAATVDPESGQASDYFEYVAAGEYAPAAVNPYGAGGRTAVEPLAGGHSAETIERVVLTGLRPSTTYHYRVVVSNANALIYGPDETFTTAPGTPPTITTGPAVEVSATSATLTGMVGPRGLPTGDVFEVGTDTSYGGARLFGNAGSSTGEVPVTATLQYLVPGTTYHYRLAASNFDGTSYGQDGTFTTPGVPSAVVQPSSAPLIASPVVRFPSIAGAITEPQGKAKPKKALTRARKLLDALRACRKREKPGRRRTACEARAHKRYQRTVKTNKSRNG